MARISVITATLNRRETLRRALDSVKAQGLDNVEHIVVDGMSNDGTAEMLASYAGVFVIREPDRNLYEAWNKGLRRATGDILCILNSDDEIPAGTFAKVRHAFNSDRSVTLISGAVEIANLDDPSDRRIIDDPRILSLREQDIGPGIPVTNGHYLTRRLVQQVGSFDERYRLVSDRDYLLRVILARPRHAVLPDVVYRYYTHAGSLTLAQEGARDRLSEESVVAARNGMLESISPTARNAYVRWHAWASFYATGNHIRNLALASAAKEAVRAFRVDPAWPLRAVGPIVRHISERNARRGRQV
jgi:glycosyltransferase involved in cell wall biosynthesis